MTEKSPAAKMAEGAAALSVAFFSVGTEEDPNVVRLADKSDWERCLKHPLHPVERPAGQTYAANFAHNWTDGVRVAIIYLPIALLVLWALLRFS